MPAIRDFAVTEQTTTVTSVTPEMPVHEAGDILVVFANKDSSSGMTETTGLYQQLNSSASGTAAWGASYWRRANSATETAPTFTFSVETANIVVVAVKNGHGTNSPTGYVSSNDNTLPWTQDQSISTPSNNCLVLHGVSTDAGCGPVPYPGQAQVLYGGDAGANSMGVSWAFYPTASTAVNPVIFFGHVQDDARVFTVVIEDDGNNSQVDAYVDRGSAGPTMITPWPGASLLGFVPQGSLSLGSIGGVSTAYDAIGSTADSGVNPYWNSWGITPSQSATALGGTEGIFSSPQNWSSGYILFTYRFNTARDFVDTGYYSRAGINVTFLDTSNNYKSWIVGAKDSPTTAKDGRNIVAIQPGQSTNTTWASNGTLSTTTIDTIMTLQSTPYGAGACLFSMLMLSGEAVLAGGRPSDPLTFSRLVEGMVNGCSLFPVMNTLGSAATIWNPVRVGGGDPVHVDVKLRTFQFPTAANETLKLTDWHVDANQVGIEFYGKSGDTIKFTNCAFTSDSSYYWRINASASSGASWDFSGTSVVNAVVTLRNVVDFTNMTFTNCTSVTANGCTLRGCTITGAPAGGAGVTVDGSSVLDECSINTTSVAGGNAFLATATPSAISGCSFTGSGASGHAIRLTATGTFTFEANTFSGYGSDGTTSAAVFNDSGGAVVLNVTGGGDTPTIRNGSGASTTINNAVTVKVTVKDQGGSVLEGARVGIFRESDGTEVVAEESDSLGVVETSYNYDSDTAVIVRVRKASSGDTKYLSNETSGTITAVGFTSTVSMVEDAIVGA